MPPEEELAALLGASRSTTREAVRALVTAHVLDVRRGDGTFVTSLEPELLLQGLGLAVTMMREESLLELLEARRAIEPFVTSLAAERLSRRQLEQLASSLERMRGSVGDYEQLVVHDAAFHASVAAGCGNKTLASVLTGLSSRTIRARVWRAMTTEGIAADTIAQHEQILAALQKRDSGLASAAALAHVTTTEHWFRSASTDRGPK